MTSTAGKYPIQTPGLEPKAVGRVGVIAFSVVFITLSLVQLYATVVLWPPELPEDTATTDSSINFLWWSFALTREQHFLLLVAVLGGLGAIAHVMRSFFKCRRAPVGLELDGLVFRDPIPGCRRRAHHVHRSPGRLARPVDGGREYVGNSPRSRSSSDCSVRRRHPKLKDVFDDHPRPPPTKAGIRSRAHTPATVPSITSFAPPSGPEKHVRRSLSGRASKPVTSVTFEETPDARSLVRAHEAAGHNGSGRRRARAVASDRRRH